MNTIWTYEQGSLIASDGANRIHHSWLVDEQLGAGLAELLNRKPGIGKLLLSPVLGQSIGKSRFPPVPA